MTDEFGIAVLKDEFPTRRLRGHEESLVVRVKGCPLECTRSSKRGRHTCGSSDLAGNGCIARMTSGKWASGFEFRRSRLEMNIRWQGLTLTLVAPDESVKSIGRAKLDSNGSARS